MDRGETRTERGTSEDAGASARAASRRLDRAHVAAIIQQVPREAYTLAMRGVDPTTGATRWRRGRIADVDGHAVLGLIDDGRVCLRLRDIDAQLAHFEIRPPEVPIAVPPRHRLRHGLIIASPDLRLTLDEPLGDGALLVLQGGFTRATNATASTTFTLGAVAPWRPRASTTITTGGETLIALTVEAVPSRRFAGVTAAASSLRRGASTVMAAIVGGDAGWSAPDADFVLVRTRSAGRVAP